MTFSCSDRFKSFLTELPKCEHHLHLEGTLEPSLLFSLAKRNNITLPAHFPPTVEACNERYSNFVDLQDFLDHYYIGMSVLITEDDFYELAEEYFRKAARDGCLHSEVFFDPQGHVERGIPIETVVNGLRRACIDATKQLGTTNKLIMCLLRHLPGLSGLETIESVSHYFENGTINGLGLDSSEKLFPPELFIECFSAVKSRHPTVGLTAHAGEEGDHTFISDSLDMLGVTRIDHGVNSYQSEELMKRLATDRIMLSMCPLSNVKLQVVSNLSELPIRLFYEKGILFSINSDDPAYFGGYILDNYVAVHTQFGFSVAEWRQIALNSINGSWCDEKRKQQLRSMLEQVYSKYKDLSF